MSISRPATTAQGLPLLVDLVGSPAAVCATPTGWLSRKHAGAARSPDRRRRMPPVVVAFPDCFTRIGGNQYVNSAAIGPWEDSCCTRCCPRSSSASRCGGAGQAWRVRQELRRIRRHHARAAPFRRLGGGGMPLRRYGLRAVLSARHARDVARARRRRNSIERWWRQAGGREETARRRLHRDERTGHGGQLRSRPGAVPRHAPAGDVRHLRGDRGPVGELAAS